MQIMDKLINPHKQIKTNFLPISRLVITQYNQWCNNLRNYLACQKLIPPCCDNYSTMFRSLLFISILIFTLPSLGQQKYRVTGTVTQTDTALGGATLMLFNADSVLLKTTLSNLNGYFAFEGVKSGKYTIAASFTGKKTVTTDWFELQNADLQLSPIQLFMDNTVQLNEVTVTARKLFVERKVDRTVINPDALISNAGASALEVLEKSPGVLVNEDGMISLQGKSGVLVMLDDRPTYLAAADLAGYLRALPAASIESIEIMLNPPAAYDAAGNAGIINIKTKKQKVRGINGNITLSAAQGFYARTNNAFSINYRNQKWNIFSTLSYQYTTTFQDLTISRTYTDPALATAVNPLNFTQKSWFRRIPRSVNIKLGADYYLNSTTTIGIALSGFQNKLNQDLSNGSALKTADASILSTVKAVSPTRRRMNNGGVNLNFTKKLAGKSGEIAVNADYLNYAGRQNNALKNEVFDEAGNLLNTNNLKSKLPTDINIYAIKADYTMPAGKKAKFSTGVKYSYVDTRNVAQFYDEVTGILIPNYRFSNEFLYRENIQAAYVNYQHEGKKFSWQTGLRLENTSLKGHQLGNPQQKDSSFTRDYLNFFPTVFITYTPDSARKHVWALNLGRRINRPNYQDLNPFIYPLDLFTLYSGNPFLQPTFSYHAEVSHTYNSFFTTSLSYDYVKDIITETIEQREGIFYSRPGNIGRQSTVNLALSGSVIAVKNLQVQWYAALVYNRTTSRLYGQNLLNEGVYAVVNPVMMYQAGKGWSFELGGSYQSKVYSGQFQLIPVGQARMAAAKTIWKNKGSIKLGLNDIFYTNQPGGDIVGLGNATAGWKSYLDTRLASLSLNYRFSKGKGASRRESNSAEEEKGRVKVNS